MFNIYIASPETLNQHADYATESDGLVLGSGTIRRRLVAIYGVKIQSA